MVAGLVMIAGCTSKGHSSVAAGAQTTKPVGPFLSDPNDPTKADTHWHAALGVYGCDHWLGDHTGAGIWNWPFATPEGAPARASEADLYAGLHSHDDGIIHMEPLLASEAGSNATIGLYIEYGGWKVSDHGFSFLDTSVENGNRCGGRPAAFQWEVGRWNGDVTGKRRQTYTVEAGDPAHYKLYDNDIVVLAFLPQGTPIASIGDPPSRPHLPSAIGAESASPQCP